MPIINLDNVNGVLYSEPELTRETRCPRHQSIRAVTWTGHPVSELDWSCEQREGLGEIRKTKTVVFYMALVPTGWTTIKTFLNTVVIWGPTSLKRIITKIKQ